MPPLTEKRVEVPYFRRKKRAKGVYFRRKKRAKGVYIPGPQKGIFEKIYPDKE